MAKNGQNGQKGQRPGQNPTINQIATNFRKWPKIEKMPVVVLMAKSVILVRNGGKSNFGTFLAIVHFFSNLGSLHITLPVSWS